MSTQQQQQDNDVVLSKKQALRKEIRSKMRELGESGNVEEQSRAVWDRLMGLEVYQRSRSVGLFLSMPQREIQTSVMVERVLTDKKTLYVPVVGKSFELADMELIRVHETEPPDFSLRWPKNKWSIPEPPEETYNHDTMVSAKPGDIDLLVVPGLAFDREGGRLGQGKGYYDRFIARMRADKKKPALVAVGLEPQLLENGRIPMTERDYYMEMVVLPNETVEIAS